MKLKGVLITAYGKEYVEKNLVDSEGNLKAESLPSEADLKAQRRKVVEPIIAADTNFTDQFQSRGIAIGGNRAKRKALNAIGVDASDADFSEGGKYADKEKYNKAFSDKLATLGETQTVVNDESLKAKIKEQSATISKLSAKVENAKSVQNAEVEKMRTEMKKDRFAMSILSNAPEGKKLNMPFGDALTLVKTKISDAKFDGDDIVIKKSDDTTYRDEANERDLTAQEIVSGRISYMFADVAPEPTPQPTPLPNDRRLEVKDGEVTKEQAIKAFQEKRKTAYVVPE